MLIHPRSASPDLRRRLPALLLVLLLLGVGCGGDPAVEEDSASQEDDSDKDDARDSEEEEEEPAEDEETEAAEEPTDDEETEAAEEPSVEPTKVATAEPAPTEAPAAPATPTPAPEVAVPSGGQDEADAMGAGMGAGGATSYDSYVTITDDTGAIQLDVPAEWTEVDGAPYNDAEGRQLFDVRAAADLQTFLETWDAPGVIVTASTEVARTENEVTLLDESLDFLAPLCTYLGREPYDDGLYSGQFDAYENCGGTETGYLVLGAVPSSRAFVIRVQVQVVEERDIEALITALNTFVITGDV